MIDDVRGFLAWQSPDTDQALTAFQYLLDLVIVTEQLIADRERIRQLSPHWRMAAKTADSAAERETWTICADQLDDTLAGR